MFPGRRWLIGLVLLFLALPLSCGAQAELEPNDSLDSPQVLTVGELEGEVSSSFDATGPIQIDRDIFAVDVEMKHVLELSFKKTDLGPHAISIRTYDEEKMRLHSPLDMVLSVPGEVFIGRWENTQNSRSRVHLVVEGNGTYHLNVNLTPIKEVPPPPQRHDSWEQAQYVDEGSYSGYVHDADPNITESHYYRIMVPAWEALEITLEKTDNETGMVYLQTYSRRLEVPSSWDISLGVSGPGKNDSDVWECYYCSDTSVVVAVRGRGGYNLTMLIVPSQEGDYMDEEAYLVILVFMMLFTLLPFLVLMIIPIMAVIIIIALIVWALKRSNANAKPSGPKSGSKLPGIDHPPPQKKKKKPMDKDLKDG